MWLTRTSIQRPIFLTMFVLALFVLGMQSRGRMPAELTPKIDIPYITVSTTYAGAGPAEVETLVSEPIEKAVASVGDLKNVTSSSQDSISTVVLEFEIGTDLEVAAADVRDKVASIRARLPDDIDEPRVLKLDTSSEPVMVLGLEGPLDSKEMKILADDVIADRLSKVGGTAAVQVIGGDEREVSVAVDKARLEAYGIGTETVVAALQAANLNIPAGSIKEDARDYSIRTVGEYSTAREIAETTLPVPGADGQVLRIRDIADVTDTIAEKDVILKLNGKPSVILFIQKQADANTVAVADGVRAEMKKLEPMLPAGVRFIEAMDNSESVRDSLKDVNKSLLEGILLVVVIVFLFLHTARATFIVAVAIPTSIVSTFIPISAFGFTQNIMVMLALSLVVGILVDDSIVVLENIERHLRKRESPVDAAYNGRSEIGLAAITITMVDIVVFLPIAFMGGMVGQFFKQFGVTVAIATGFSLLMSFTLTPMLASRWMRSEEDKETNEEAIKRRAREHRATFRDRIDLLAGSLFDRLDSGLQVLDSRYRGVLEWSLHNRFFTLMIGFTSLLVVLAMPNGAPGFLKLTTVRVVIALIVLGLAAVCMGVDRQSRRGALGFGLVAALIALTVHLPFGFGLFPVVDKGQLSVSITAPPGTSLAATQQIVTQVGNLVRGLPEMKEVKWTVSDRVFYKPGTWFKSHTESQKGFVFSVVGSDQPGMMGGNQGPQYGYLSAKVVDKQHRSRSIGAIVEGLAQRTARIPGAERISVSVSSGVGPPNNIQKEVQGTNFTDMMREAELVADTMRRVPGAVDVDISYKPNRPERRIVVDRVRAAKLGLSVAQVGTAARTAIDGNDDVKLRDSGTEYPIRVHYNERFRSSTSDVGNMIIATRDRAPVYLKDVAKVVEDSSPTKIDRKNRQRVIYVTANLARGAEMGNVNAAIEKGLATIRHVPGTSIGTGGATDLMGESFGFMISALILAILLVYMLMGALFESFLTPLVILFCLPQALIGALLALLITGHAMSIVAMIGIIMLTGLVMKNAILLIDYTNTLMDRGLTRNEALLEAGPTRLRPIMMTTLAMIGGMLPTALATNQSAEMRAPMAITVIGGLILSTLLTLLVIPVTFTIVDDAWKWVLRTFFSRSAPETPIPEQLVPRG